MIKTRRRRKPRRHPPLQWQPPSGPVSYDKQIRPIFQAQCQGCHQPAKAGGGYVMTAFDRLLEGGEASSRDRPGKPDESHLIEQITPEDGKEMPKGSRHSRRRNRADHALDRARGGRRHAPNRPRPLRHGPSARYTPGCP